MKDPLLLAAKAIVLFLQGTIALLITMFILAIPASVIMPDRVGSLIAEAFPQNSLASPTLAVAIFASMMAGLLAVAFWFFELLRQIVRSVENGTPFAPENAVRLTKMGWIALASQVLQFPVAALAYNVVGGLGQPREGTLTFQTEIEVGVVLLALILFILARVFRHGAAMRADLEGTV